MEAMLAELAWEKCLIYLDVIVVFGTTWAEHLQRLRQVGLLEIIRELGFKFKISKCRLVQEQVAFLGYILTPQGLQPDLQKLTVLVKYPYLSL